MFLYIISFNGSNWCPYICVFNHSWTLSNSIARFSTMIKINENIWLSFHQKCLATPKCTKFVFGRGTVLAPGYRLSPSTFPLHCCGAAKNKFCWKTLHSFFSDIHFQAFSFHWRFQFYNLLPFYFSFSYPYYCYFFYCTCYVRCSFCKGTLISFWLLIWLHTFHGKFKFKAGIKQHHVILTLTWFTLSFWWRFLSACILQQPY